ncbi:MAG: M24 family metallopeptidase [Planctomycetota bacterium]|nr:M24 family metallopeptidase [Planctomycetota bacterium]
MFDLDAIQAAIKEFGFDGWLLHDFRGSNVLAKRVLGLPEDVMLSRRLYYSIPAEGEPRKLVHRIESDSLDHLPGTKTVYLKWQALEAGVQELLGGMSNVAMEYSPRNANPYVSRIDAGTIELVRSFGVEVASSGNLIQLFEASWSDEQWALHQQAAVHTNSAFQRAWQFIASEVRAHGSVEESAVRAEIMSHFAEHRMTTYHPPIVGVGPNSGNPHYETGTGQNTTIREGDFVLIDLWAKMNQPGAGYSDLTRTGFVGESVPDKYTKIFNIVAASRDAAIEFLRASFAKGETVQGWQVDQATRDVIEAGGYGDAFVHRTGHSIGQEVHGNGANIDNLETREERHVLPRTCFSIEPGIYLPEFGVRSEIDVYIDEDRNVHVTGGELQTAIVAILKDGSY